MNSDLKVLTKAYDKVGITYVLKQEDGYTYLFVCSPHKKENYERCNLKWLTSSESFIEFNETGELISY